MTTTDNNLREYQVILTSQARQLLVSIKDRREQQLILSRLEKLKQEPEKQGKALSDDLIGYRSIRAVGQRYRIIYKIEAEQVIVTVVGIGRRKEGSGSDVYEVTKKIICEMTPDDDSENN